MHSLPCCHHPHQMGCLLQSDTSSSPRVHGLHQGSLVAHFVGLDKHVTTHIHHYDVTQKGFVTQRSSVLHLFLPPPNPGVITVSTVLPFPQCHTVGIYSIWCFLYWLLSLSMHLSFLHVMSFHGLVAHFFSAE